MAIEGYRTIPTDGSGELYSWPGCVVLVNRNWEEGPAFAERVVATDHADAAMAFRDLAGWLLTNAGDTEADFAAVIQTGDALLCMAAGGAEVLLGDGRTVASDTSGMWAQLVVPERPDRIELGVSAGVAPDRIDLDQGVVPAAGALLIPGAGADDASNASDAAVAADENPAASHGAEASAPVESAPGDAISSGGARVGGVSRPGRSDGAAVGSQHTTGEHPGDLEAAVASEPVSEAAAVGSAGAGDPRGSPDEAAGHELPFDDELDGGPPTDADGLIGIVSEEPEPSGTSGSDTDVAARPDPDTATADAGSGVSAVPEPTGEHRTASSFDDESVADERPEAPASAPPQPGLPKGEATGLVPIVTTPEVSGASPFEPAVGRAEPSVAEPGAADPGDEGGWPPPPAWAASDTTPPEPGEGDWDRKDSGGEAAAASEESATESDQALGEETGAHGALVPADGEASTDDGDADADAIPSEDTNEAAWPGGLDDDQSIPLLLFDDGVAVELPGDVLIGRRPDPGVRDDPSRLHTLTMTDDSQAVSRNHVELRRREDEVSILDCGSANGTFVEATPGELTRLDAEAPHVLRDGERVVFGKRWFEYRAPRVEESDE